MALVANRQGFMEGAQCQAAMVETRHADDNMLGGFDMWCNTLGFSLFGTLKHAASRTTLRLARRRNARRFANLCLTANSPSTGCRFAFPSNTNHEEDQPVHLHVKGHGPAKGVRARRLCWARRRAIARRGFMSGSRKRRDRLGSLINAQNCVHCKTFATSRTPIRTSPGFRPEGGGGPNYPNM